MWSCYMHFSKLLDGFVQVITCICKVMTCKVENVVGMPLVVPRTIDFDTCSYDDLADYALPSEKREM